MSHNPSPANNNTNSHTSNTSLDSVSSLEIDSPEHMSTEPLLANSQSLEPTPLQAHQPSSKHHHNSLRSRLFWIFGPWLLGGALALIIPSHSYLPEPQKTTSHFIGWVYFSAWTISFYPQLYLNYRRKSVAGLSLDFQVLNLLGFASYTIYNCALYFNPTVRKQYAVLHDGLLPAVHLNDVFFALHAAIITAVTLGQCVMYDRGNAKVPRTSIILCIVTTIVAIGWAVAIIVIPTVDPHHCTHTHSCPPDALFTWLSWLYFLSYIKLAITIVKYVPQVILNYRLQSTDGWNVWNVLLDIEGGVLSLGQLLLDASTCSDWSPVTGNPVKFALGWTSMIFDFVFVVQHYCLYAAVRKERLFALFESDIERAVLVVPGSGDDGSDGDDDVGSVNKKYFVENTIPQQQQHNGNNSNSSGGGSG